jgi:hypothetical protein
MTTDSGFSSLSQFYEIRYQTSQKHTIVGFEAKELGSSLAMALPPLTYFLPDNELEELDDDGDFAIVPFTLVCLGPRVWHFKGWLAEIALANG